MAVAAWRILQHNPKRFAPSAASGLGFGGLGRLGEMAKWEGYVWGMVGDISD